MIELQKVVAEPSAAFARVFSEAVDDAMHRLGRLKKQLAHDCGMRPDRFSHLQSGRRGPPRRDTVLAIARGLRLDDAASNRLLEAAGYAPLPQQHDITALLSRLGEPERTIAQGEVEGDIELIRRAWNHYVSAQSHNLAREWVDAGNLYEQGLDQYWQLRTATARFYAQVHLAAATSHYYRNHLDQAERLCREGLGATAGIDNKMFEVMLLVRLASIERLRSRYDDAGDLYERALSVLERWEARDGRRDHGRDVRQDWRAHWRARIHRMQGTLELFKGSLPAIAIAKLKPSLEHFQRVQNGYELSQACYGLGWASSLIGEYEAATSWYRQGLAHAQAYGRVGREDQRALLQGHLYLGSAYLETGDPERAFEELERAEQFASGRLLTEYQEVGRVYLIQAKVHIALRSFDAAHDCGVRALRFFQTREERVQLAQAHNVMGDQNLASGGPAHVQRALAHYRSALQAALSSRPPSAYYQCAAMVNLCRARVTGHLPAAEMTYVADRSPNAGRSEADWDVDELIAAARRIGSQHRYRNHLARLSVLEAEWALACGNRARAEHAAADALHFAGNFNRHLHRTVRNQLLALGFPPELLDAPLVLPDDSRHA